MTTDPFGRFRSVPLSAAACWLALCVGLVVTRVAPAQVFESLVTNPGGESPSASRLGESQGKAYYSVEGWEARSGEWVAQTSGFSKVDAVEGEAFFRPSGGKAPELVQEVRIDALAAKPARFVVAGAWHRTWKGRDGCEVVLELLDVNRAPLPRAAARTGMRRASDWTWSEVRLAVSTGAAFARITLRGELKDGKYCDAFFDGVVLEAWGASHPAVFADLATPELVARLSGSSGAERRALLQALAFRDVKGARAVADLLPTAQTPAERAHLTTLVALGADRRLAEDVVGEALHGGDPALREVAFDLLADAPVDAADSLMALARDTSDDRLRRRVLRALADLPGKDGARALQKLGRERREGAMLDVLRAVQDSRAEPDAVYRPLLAKYLSGDAEADLRDAAMRALGSLGDPRFLKHLEDLAEHAGSVHTLTAWFGYAAALDSPAAMQSMMEVVAADTPHAPAAFLVVVPRMRNPEVKDWLRNDALRHESPLVRLGAVRALRATASEDDVRALRRAFDDADPLVALEAVDALAAVDGADADELLAKLVERGSGAVAAAALRARWTRGSKDAAAADGLLAAASEHQAWQARAAALELLPADAVRRGRTAVVARFDDEVWQVRVAAYGALAKLREKASIATLIDRLPDEDGSAMHFLIDRLVDLTGVDRGLDPAVWERWWQIVANTFEVPKDRQKVARSSSGAGGKTVTAYHGIPIRSDKIVFIIDLSGSMTAKAGEKTRLDMAKDELTAVLRQLTEGMSFNVIGFGTGVTSFEPQLVPVNEENVADACRWVEGLRVAGATNIYDSLETALYMDGVESIFLLSDGGPSAGKFVEMDEIRRVIKRLNSDLKVRVNTIMIGAGGRAFDFMEKLADENDGESKGK